MRFTRGSTTWGVCLVASLLPLAACTAADAKTGTGTAEPPRAGSATAAPTTLTPVPASSPARAPVAAVGTQDPIGAVGGRGLLIDAVPAGSGTVVRGFDRTTHSLVRSVRLVGHYGLPLVVPGDPAEGISHDGSVVVLATASPTPASPTTASRFVVLNADLTTAPRSVVLPAGFSYDALSPDGSKLYLIEHLGTAASEHYQVRSYDLASGRLDDGVIADKTKVAEWMAGHPTSRVTSADGSIVATMYERDGGEPFVHVLHADQGFATCIDLPRSARGLVLTGSGDGHPLMLQDAAGLNRWSVDLDTATVAGPAAFCAAVVSRAALPVWAREGFSGDGSGVPHVTSRDARLIAVLFSYPLTAAADLSVENKVLWIPGPQPPDSPSPGVPSSGSTYDVGLSVEGTLTGSALRISRLLPGGPGPSLVTFPQGGCWNLTLRWSGHTDTVVLPVG